ncbi:MAG: hypothetical protein RLN89_08200 [Parvibaculum sp.]
MTDRHAPDPFIAAARPFNARARDVNLIALALGLYIFIVLFPAYAFLRIWWTGELAVLSFANIFTAIVIGCLFGLFARALIRHTLGIRKP